MFVIMPFTGQDEILESIRKGCSLYGLEVHRVDKTVGGGVVLNKIIKHIVEAEFVVCDLTNERPNVYYELGFAVGVGNLPEDILLIAKAGTSLHFDVSPFHVEFYQSPEHLQEIVQASMQKMIAKRMSYPKRLLVQAIRKMAQRVSAV